MFQARDIMELPPDPNNNPHRDRQDQIFRSGIQPIISDDAALGKRKASLTAAEGAKARKIASIVQSDFMHELQRPEEFYRPEALDFNAPVVQQLPRPPLASWPPVPTEFIPPTYYGIKRGRLNPDQNPPVYRTETQRAYDPDRPQWLRSPYDYNEPTLADVLRRRDDENSGLRWRKALFYAGFFKSEL